jgi:elongator complex protein 3
MEELARQIISEICSGKIKDERDLAKRKAMLAGERGIGRFPKNSEILEHATEEEYNIVLPFLLKKPTRTLSGVAVIAAMTKPHECPHGKCIYCPGGLELDVPQSYTGKEPAARRAVAHGFDPYLQVQARLEQLAKIGHSVDKCELITMGGTLLALDDEYQEYFVKGCLQAMNDFGLRKRSPEGESLASVQTKNETANARCVGMTFETRPDYAFEPQVDAMLRLGGTKVELGVQTLSDAVYKKVDRGHTIADVAKATQLCRDALIKVGYQMMPGLFATQAQDYKMFKELFTDERFMPDLLKFYPCLVIKGTKLYDLWKKGEYTPYTTEDAVKLIAKIKKIVPPWVRIIRIQRDIPINFVEAGVVKSNLRELVVSEMQSHGDKCRCIRCREIGLKSSKEGLTPDADAIELVRRDYRAAGGDEIFLSFEDKTNDMLAGFLRLRRPSAGAHRLEMCDAAGVRELHVYGPMVEIGEKAHEKWQHRGYGSELLKEAERIALEEWDLRKIKVISGIGVRDYYRKFGYERVGPYMGKEI